MPSTRGPGQPSTSSTADDDGQPVGEGTKGQPRPEHPNPVGDDSTIRTVTNDEIAAIKQRADNATPGPWEWLSDHGDETPFYDHEDQRSGDMLGPIMGTWGNDGTAGIAMPVADAEFIAHAREDIHALLAEIARLRANDLRNALLGEERYMYEDSPAFQMAIDGLVGLLPLWIKSIAAEAGAEELIKRNYATMPVLMRKPPPTPLTSRLGW
jgi:hypothetical protein